MATLAARRTIDWIGLAWDLRSPPHAVREHHRNAL